MVPMARILVVGVVFIAAPCAFAELKPTRQPTSANAAAETNFMLSPLCVWLRRRTSTVGSAPREFRGMELHELAHACRLLPGEFEHVIRHAVVTPLLIEFCHHPEVL